MHGSTSPDLQSAPQQAAAPAPAGLPARLAIVIPTFNEVENVPILINRLSETLAGIPWEAVFVDDDSKDGTVDALRAAAQADPRVRLVHRIGRRGLSSAVVEGIQSTSAPLVAVMDADLQHDETLLPRMAEQFADPSVDLVVGSRYMAGGGVGEWSKHRQTVSRVATQMSRLIVKADLSDPMSGFFMIRRASFDVAARQLSSQGYKILLDIIASAPRRLKIKELPFEFSPREHGESKLDSMVTWEYIALLLDKSIGRFVPARFVMFSMVGGAGVFVHMATLALMFQGFRASFDVGQATAAAVAMTFNYFVNNLLTYRDRRLKGFWGNVRGLLSFYAVGAIGAIANVGVANALFVEQHYSWVAAAIAGILVGAVWNYGVSAIFTWRSK
ncbi:MAG: glycosyltransferase family 2 protein [Hyphomonadaceae bacterium]|nr:glycosyltransferase family 2 protein [Hyphomonadaceae bacterium]